MSDELNPLSNVYKEFQYIVENSTIKYSAIANSNEETEYIREATGYIDTINKTDRYNTYKDYTIQEIIYVGITDPDLIQEIYSGNVEAIPSELRESLLNLRRQRVIDSYEEKNNYYRMLNGLPDYGTDSSKFHYITDEIASTYSMDKSIPIHLIQDYYNNELSGKGDKMISILEGIGYIDTLKSLYPEEEYLKHIGGTRVDIVKARTSKNFALLNLPHTNIGNIMYDEFISIYESARNYFLTVVYNRDFNTFIDYYDNFIAMCIMVMAIQQTLCRQFSLTNRRNFFDLFSIQMLYDVYNVPYDLSINTDIQQNIVQNLNMLISNKSTNNVIYDLTELLGLSDIKVYKYFLAKVRKYDNYGVPIFKTTSKFNTNTGEMESIPDYEAMFDLYFQKEELKEDDFIQSVLATENHVDYDEITKNDPYWNEDTDVYNLKYESEYNFVETKYLSLGVSYKMLDILFDNVILLKMIMKNRDSLSNVKLTIPKITDGSFQIYDLIIYLLCMISKKHNLTGQILSVPSEILSELDYLRNVNCDKRYVVDSFAFDFDYFISDTSQEAINKLTELLGDDAEKFVKYISVLSFNSNASGSEKLKALNDMYQNIRGLMNFISYKMTQTQDIELYQALREFYDAAFYADEMKEMYTLTGGTTGYQRTAKTFFEYLYYYNPILYMTVFKMDYNEQYEKYLTDNNLDESFTYEEFMSKVEDGSIELDYSEYNPLIITETTNAEETMLNYIYHVISRFKIYIDDINFNHMIDDTSTSTVTLLVKLIQFIKSLTTEFIGLDTLYIMNVKPENLLKFIDVIHSISKEVQISDSLNFTYADSVHGMISEIYKDDSLKFKNEISQNSTIVLDFRSNAMKFKDEVYKMEWEDA